MCLGGVKFWSCLWRSGVTENSHQRQRLFLKRKETLFKDSGFQLKFILNKSEITWHLWEVSVVTKTQTVTYVSGPGVGDSACFSTGRSWSPVRGCVSPDHSLPWSVLTQHEVPLTCLQLPKCGTSWVQFDHTWANVLSLCFTVDTYSHVAPVYRYPRISSAIHELYVTQGEPQLLVPKCLISAEVMQDILTG